MSHLFEQEGQHEAQYDKQSARYDLTINHDILPSHGLVCK
jgi:hypothetical protein